MMSSRAMSAGFGSSAGVLATPHIHKERCHICSITEHSCRVAVIVKKQVQGAIDIRSGLCRPGRDSVAEH